MGGLDFITLPACENVSDMFFKMYHIFYRRFIFQHRVSMVFIFQYRNLRLVILFNQNKYYKFCHEIRRVLVYICIMISKFKERNNPETSSCYWWQFFLYTTILVDFILVGFTTILLRRILFGNSDGQNIESRKILWSLNLISFKISNKKSN